MDDYVIGIRLALDNGVSAGLSSIRADLAALDKSVAASAEGLRQLSAPSFQAPTRLHPVPPIVQPPQDAPAEDWQTAQQPPAQAAASPVSAVPGIARVRIEPAAPSAPSSSQAPIFTPQPAPIPSQAAFSVSQSNPVSVSYDGPTIAPKAMSPALTSIARPSRAAEAAVAPVMLSPAQIDAPISQYHPGYAPQAQSADIRPASGDVFLDGERLGHWIANHLARPTNRPGFGNSNFDPSLSLSWPGAAQGGH